MDIWKIARELAKEIFLVTKQDNFKNEFKLREQMKASSGSVMDNIAEGFGRSSRLEFVQFLSIANDSLSELKSQLYRVLDYQYIDKLQFENLYYRIDNTCKKIQSLINYLNSTETKGLKFKNRV